MAKYLSEHFSLDEMVFSQTAARLGIDNTPSKEVIDNLRRVCEALEAVRRDLGELPLLVSSGYRSPALNEAVRGAKNSAHLKGLAADFTMPQFGSTLKVAQAVAGCGLPFDQVIHEYGRWVHLGLAPSGLEPAGQTLSIFAGTGYIPGLQAGPFA